MGLFSSIAGIFGARAKGKAAKKAAAAQVAALQQGIAAVTEQNAALQQRLSPFIDTGIQSLDAQKVLLGLGGAEQQNAALAALKDSPLFKTLFNTGQETILANASATGGLRGGNVQRSLADFGADTFTKVLLTQLDQLGGLAGQGRDTAVQGGTLGADAASALAELFSGQGSARAGGIIGKANAKADMFGSIGDALGSAASAFLPTGGLGGTIRGLI